MATVQDRLGSVLERLATGTNVHRSRTYDRQRATRNGTLDGGLTTPADMRLEAAIAKFEAAADELWSALDMQIAPASEQIREAA